MEGVDGDGSDGLLRAIGGQDSKGELGWGDGALQGGEGEDVLDAVFLPTYGVQTVAGGGQGCVGLLQRLFFGDLADVLLEEVRCEKGVFQVLDFRGVDRFGILFQEFIGRFHRRFGEGFSVESCFAFGLGDAFGLGRSGLGLQGRESKNSRR